MVWLAAIAGATIGVTAVGWLGARATAGSALTGLAANTGRDDQLHAPIWFAFAVLGSIYWYGAAAAGAFALNLADDRKWISDTGVIFTLSIALLAAFILFLWRFGKRSRRWVFLATARHWLVSKKGAAVADATIDSSQAGIISNEEKADALGALRKVGKLALPATTHCATRDDSPTPLSPVPPRGDTYLPVRPPVAECDTIS